MTHPSRREASSALVSFLVLAGVPAEGARAGGDTLGPSVVCTVHTALPYDHLTQATRSVTFGNVVSSRVALFAPVLHFLRVSSRLSALQVGCESSQRRKVMRLLKSTCRIPHEFLELQDEMCWKTRDGDQYGHGPAFRSSR